MKIFISYAREDEDFKNKLLTHLDILIRNGVIESRHDGLIKPGEEWDESIKSLLYECDVILFLMSAGFLASDYIHNTEIKIALERIETESVRIIPVILKPCLWKYTEVAQFQALPKDAKPLSTWQNIDEGLLNIAEGIVEIINTNQLTKKVKEQAFLKPGKLSVELIDDLNTDNNIWENNHNLIQNLRDELLDFGVPVGSNRASIFEHYGWLIEEFLRKLSSKLEKGTEEERKIRRLSFMAEVYQSSLRYLCYIQIAQILKKNIEGTSKFVHDFYKMNEGEFKYFDFIELLKTSNELLTNEENFVLELPSFIGKLSNSKNDLSETISYLGNYRFQFLKNKIPKNENLDQLLNEYLAVLVFWLQRIAFLAKYRMVSIYDIFLNYRLGTNKNFIHSYCELHGLLKTKEIGKKELSERSITDFFTYNKSVLFFKGNNVDSCFSNIHNTDSYISLSPLIIDKSVYAKEKKQTLEVYYYAGRNNRQYTFSKFSNELVSDGRKEPNYNKRLSVPAKSNNDDKTNLNKLHKQILQVLKPFNGW